MTSNHRSRLIRPGASEHTRRDALRIGAMGLGGLAIGGSFIAACGSDDDDSSSDGGGGDAKDSIKAHWVYIGPPDDNGWTQEHERGRQLAQSTLGDKMESAFTPNILFDASTTQLFQQLADDGNDVVFANTEYASLLSEVAADNPDTIFMEANGHVFTDNHFPFYVAHEIPAYLLGVAAGLLTPNGKIGYIGAFPTASAFNDVNGMLLGARSVNPDATVDTVMANTFFDPQVAAQAADALLANGVEFLFGIMDEPTFLQKAEEADVWTGYWNLDQRAAAPTKYLNNYDLSEFGTFYTTQCQAVLDGSWTTRTEVDMLESPLGAWGDEVPQEVQDQVDGVAAQIASGDVNVYEGPIVDSSGTERVPAGESIDSIGAYNIDFAVEGVSGL